jgi:hypothetical protein
MGKKLEEVRSKKVLEYKAVEIAHPSNGKRIFVPRIDKQQTITMERLIQRAADQGYMIGKGNLFQSQFDCIMTLVQEYLLEGYSVNLGGYMRLQLCLTGNLNEKKLITPENNKLELKISPLRKLKLKLQNFAWRLKGDRLKEL